MVCNFVLKTVVKSNEDRCIRFSEMHWFMRASQEMYEAKIHPLCKNSKFDFKTLFYKRNLPQIFCNSISTHYKPLFSKRLVFKQSSWLRFAVAWQFCELFTTVKARKLYWQLILMLKAKFLRSSENHSLFWYRNKQFSEILQSLSA